MDIKLVNKQDYDKIYTFVEEAFKTAEVSDGTEQDFVLKLRKSSNYVPELEFAAYDKNILIGHIMLTKQNLKSNKPVKAVLVAPLSVKKRIPQPRHWYIINEIRFKRSCKTGL